ncbi:MAG TPA: NYN domain-containing protein [Rubricoccaceae bacterium]|nr:NYN domain-containing protein [Rubricoccaceae bacterium]
MSDATTPATPAHCAAVLVDYQNLYHFLKNRLAHPASPGDQAAAMVEALRQRLASEGVRIARGYAYADFGGLDEHVRHVQRALYLHGIQPVYVPSTMHRNTTDLQLALDAVEIRDRHPEVDTFVLFSGDRDYVPVVQALQAAGRRVVMVAFRDHLSAHLLDFTQAGYFLPAEDLLPEEARGAMAEDGASPSAPAVHDPARFNTVKELPDDRDYDALEVIERFFGQYEEVYLTPLLRKLSEELGDFDDTDPKTLIGELEEAGAVRLERRRGMPYDYTVLILNPAHPAVQEIREEVRGAHASGDGLAEEAYDFVDDEDEEFEGADAEYDDDFDEDEAVEEEGDFEEDEEDEAA